MTPEALQPAEPEEKGMGEISRIAGVFFEPGKTFADIARRPTWVVPMVLMIVVVLVLIALFAQHVGWERAVRHQFETNPRLMQLPADQRERTQVPARRSAATKTQLYANWRRNARQVSRETVRRGPACRLLSRTAQPPEAVSATSTHSPNWLE